MNLLLGSSDTIELLAHVLNLLGLGVIDVRLSRDVFMALFDFSLSAFILLSYISLCLLRLS